MARVAIVTGASRGIGRVTARRLAKDGFSVVVNYAGNAAMAQGVVNEIKEGGGSATAIQADISNSEDYSISSPKRSNNMAGLMLS